MDLPCGWATTRLSEICEINPRVDKSAFKADAVVSFVSMPAVEAETGKIDVTEKRKFSKVKQGYTPFKEDDVLFAKITPCMENGKMAIVPKMVSKYGFGSTEFHALRPTKGIDPKFIYHMVSNQGFRYHAERNMTGAVGQKRVPAAVLEEYELGLPPTNEQRRIVEQIEALFKDIDKGVESLRATKASIGLYRQSLLKSAFEGRLTADWRTQNADKLESTEVLLARIRAEREARYTATVAAWQEALVRWRVGGEKGKRPRKPKRPDNIAPLGVSELKRLPTIPDAWGFSRLGIYIEWIEAGKSFRCFEIEPRANQVGVAKVSAVTWGKYDETESKTCLNEAKVDESLFIQDGDFLLSRANTIELVGASVIATKVTKRIMLSDKTLRIHFIPEEYHIFLQYLRSPLGRSEIETRSTGNQESMRNIGQDRIKSIIVPVIHEAEQAEIVRLLDTRLDAADALEAEIDAALTRATAMRQSILKKAFSGKLVPQDPQDEPATMMLERIRTERTKVTNQSRQRPARP